MTSDKYDEMARDLKFTNGVTLADERLVAQALRAAVRDALEEAARVVREELEPTEYGSVVQRAEKAVRALMPGEKP